MSWDGIDDATDYGRGLLRGERVHLRVATEEDFEHLADWWVEGEWAVLQQGTIRPQGREALKDVFRRWSKNDTPTGAGFSVVDAEGSFLGHATLFGAELPARIATFAIMLIPSAVGHGYGSEAARLMLRYAFDELGVNKVELHVWSFNARAIRAYERAGFRREGVRRAAAFHAGEFHDEVFMGILADEYRAG